MGLEETQFGEGNAGRKEIIDLSFTVAQWP